MTVAVAAFSKTLTSGVPKINSTSFSTMVTTELLIAPKTAFVGLAKETRNVSEVSMAESLMMGTVIVPLVTPAEKLTVPLLFV